MSFKNLAMESAAFLINAGRGYIDVTVLIHSYVIASKEKRKKNGNRRIQEKNTREEWYIWEK